MNVRNDIELLAVNRGFYEPLWRDPGLVGPKCFNTSPLIGPLLATRVAGWKWRPDYPYIERDREKWII